MASTYHPALQPRKTPVQTRSGVTVDAILEATIQVLLAEGKDRLTTTKVALRAGVSVGTLYQYFPNKSALLQACLKRHMQEISDAVQQVCQEYRSATLIDMGTAIIAGYLQAKMRNVKESAALYAVSSDIEGAAISKAVAARVRGHVADLFATAKGGLNKDPEVVASIVLASLHGISRLVLEARNPQKEVEVLREELLILVHSYLRTCTKPSTRTRTVTAL